jgi:MFS family permease
MKNRVLILVMIVCAQFLCVSLWFAGNAIIDDLTGEYGLHEKAIGHLISSVQLGFIAGTLFFAVMAVADRMSPSLVFFISAVLASLSNLGLMWSMGELPVMLASRFLTGFFLAGIYPVGMKIASDHFDKDLGKSLGWLLGALVLGTAFPHLLHSYRQTFAWADVLVVLSVLAVIGGLLILVFVPDGPFRRRSFGFQPKALVDVFRNQDLKAAAFGYFGHMWELYAFWTFIPLMLGTFILTGSGEVKDLPLFTFSIIAIGSVACVLGGYLSRRFGSYKVAFYALLLSGTCCLISPLVLTLNPAFIYSYFLFWGMVVIMDSPQFSTLIAQSAPQEHKASALTIVNCIGFSITILSIQLLNLLSDRVPAGWLFFLLLPGPALGLFYMLKRQLVKSK